MDFIDLFWNLSQDSKIKDLEASHSTTRVRGAARLRELQAENVELRLRLSLTIRLLIERGVFSAAEFTALLEETRAKLMEPKPARKLPPAREAQLKRGGTGGADAAGGARSSSD